MKPAPMDSNITTEAKSTALKSSRQGLIPPQIPIDPSPRTAEPSRPAISCLGASRTPPNAEHHQLRRAWRPRNLHKTCTEQDIQLISRRRSTTCVLRLGADLDQDAPATAPPKKVLQAIAPARQYQILPVFTREGSQRLDHQQRCPAPSAACRCPEACRNA